MHEEWITTQEAAEIIGVTRNHVRYLVAHGRVEAKRFGRAWMISRSSSEEYATTERKPGPKPERDT
jgi:excisionase family DNA binding protein